jgi:hypothetical protein
MNRIVSAVPGRLRLRDLALRDHQQLERLRCTIAAFDGVRSVDGNPKAGSLVVRYDVASLEPGRIEAQVEAAAAIELAKPATIGGGSRRVQVNRYAKRGMLASLGVSMLLAAIRQKRWHAASGGLFLACLVVHLGVHRRHVLR